MSSGGEAPAISWEFLSGMPREGMRAGGILPAIVGTFWLTVGTGVVAVPLGVGMGWWPRLDAFMDTTVQLLRPIPPLAWGPLAIAWFSVGISSMVFMMP
jgi:ABC-type nitrate/sulfonate/bicarbonate transport system permease component